MRAPVRASGPGGGHGLGGAHVVGGHRKPGRWKNMGCNCGGGAPKFGSPEGRSASQRPRAWVNSVEGGAASPCPRARQRDERVQWWVVVSVHGRVGARGTVSQVRSRRLRSAAGVR
eukprot:14642053-Heterocapsa_arctica.AAC.1